MAGSERAYPGIYMVCDPRPGRARADVQAMVTAAGTALTHCVAVEGEGFAIAAVSPPVDAPGCGPAVHSDARGTLIWAGEMFPPEAWLAHSTSASPHAMAAILQRKLATLGPDALADIDGSFCGAWFSAQRQTWTVFNDRWGLIPLFWWAEGSRLIVSPRARLTWQASETPLQIEADGFADLLRTQNMLDDHTLIAGVHWLEPARSLCFDGRRTQTRRYWDFQHRPQTPVSYDALLDEYLEACRATLARMTDGDAPILQGLSGGLDSRVFLAVGQQLGRVPTCYTSGFAYGEDVRFGQQLARLAAAPHDKLLLDAKSLWTQLQASMADTDGLHGAGHLVLSAPIAPYLAKHAGSVLIEGYLHGVLGGSDLPDDKDIPVDRPAHTHPWALDFLHSGGSPEQIGHLLSHELAAPSLARWQSHVDDDFSRSGVDDPLHRAEYAIITGRSGRNDVLVPAMHRRHVLARHPACDRRMLAWYATTPAALRRGRQTYIDALQHRFARFARVPRADSSSGMPLLQHRWLREWCWQREKLFTAWSRWRYADVRRYGRDALAARAWAFDVCRKQGVLEVLDDPHARVLNWVRADALRDACSAARRNPRQSLLVLTLLTAETTIRDLEQVHSLRRSLGATEPLRFQPLGAAGSCTPALAEVL